MISKRVRALVASDSCDSEGDSHAHLRRIAVLTFGMHGIDSVEARTSEDAVALLCKQHSDQGSIDIVFTYAHTLDLVRRVRCLSDDVVSPQGLRIRHIPFVVQTPNLNFRGEMTHHDPHVTLLQAPTRPLTLLVRAIDSALRAYRHHILDELLHVGYGIASERGHLRVVHVFAKPGNGIETKYLAGRREQLSLTYDRLVMISDTLPDRASVVLEEFECLLDDSRTTERDLHEFFELHPEFLLTDRYDSYWSEPRLHSPASGVHVRPDFVLQPRALRDLGFNWSVVDLKRPTEPMMTRSRFHRDLSRQVYRVAAQLRDYQAFFADPRNGEVLRHRFGAIVPNPRLVAIIGRLPKEQLEDFTRLTTRLPGVQVTTYDEILEWRRSKIDLEVRTRSRR